MIIDFTSPVNPPLAQSVSVLVIVCVFNPSQTYRPNRPTDLTDLTDLQTYRPNRPTDLQT